MVFGTVDRQETVKRQSTASRRLALARNEGQAPPDTESVMSGGRPRRVSEQVHPSAAKLDRLAFRAPQPLL